MPRTIKSAITTSGATRNGGYFCLGASAFRAGTFRKDCTTATKEFK